MISDESGVTGGSFGLSGIPDLAFEGLSPDAKQRAYYWLAFALVVATAVVIYVFIHSPLGAALKALRDSPAYAAARGVSPMRMQVITFATSAFIAGIAGGFYAQYFGTVSPSVMGLGPMALFVTMLVIGGLGTFAGPMVGTALIMVVSEYLRDFEEARLIIVGLILLGDRRRRAAGTRAGPAGRAGPRPALDGGGRASNDAETPTDRRRTRHPIAREQQQGGT